MKQNQKVVVITGGSRGIGFATAELFLKEGATVVLGASTEANAKKAVERLQKKFPSSKIEGIYPELTCFSSVKESFQKIEKELGAIDVLINNAGMSEATPFLEYSEALFDQVMDLNVKGVFHGALAAAPGMIQRGQGVILNTSSMVSIYGQPAGIAYPVSKFAVNGLTISLARELGPFGIRVNAVAPGVIETDMMKQVPKEKLLPVIEKIPLKRLGTPEDIAKAFLFLASEEASYIQGMILRVDGLASV